MKTIMLSSRTPSTEVAIMPNPEVEPKTERRRFTAEYKRRIVREADACTLPGEVGALLRREGIYSSHLAEWRRSLRQAELLAFSAKKRGPKVKVDPRDLELSRLQRENERLKTELMKAGVIIDVQKKLSGLLGISLEPQEPTESK